jgi:tRNA modification GTPase
MNDTIVGISTALGIGAISIIRVSGKESITLVNEIFKGKDLTKVNTHTIHYGHIVNKEEIIDEVLISIMKSPKTYTKEDIVEINCHGGISTTNKVLELLIQKGIRLAEPGEFTKRAFLNGRIDLIEADGIMNLIEAKTETSRKLSINQLSGNVSNKIISLRDKLIQVISNIEVNIDYPEYDDIEVINNEKILPILKEVNKSLEDTITQSENGKIITEGIKVCLIGRPNVGKSSLLNTLLEENKAIVTNIAGTTRDIVEGTIQIDNIPIHLIDTAGIRETSDIVEQIGVNKSKEVIENSDLIILILNSNEQLTEEDKYLLELIKNKTSIIVLNKIDLPSNIEDINHENIVKISAEYNIGIEDLKNKIKYLFNIDKIETTDMNYLTSARSIGLLKKAHDILKEVINKTRQGIEPYLLEIDIKEAWNILGEIIGATYKEEMLDEMFKRFCLGK